MPKGSVKKLMINGAYGSASAFLTFYLLMPNRNLKDRNRFAASVLRKFSAL
jgi:hypothetical protein